MQGKWINNPNAETTVVFVHGILSSGEACWQHDNGTYWPALLKAEPKFNALGIYVFTYQTDFFSGNYNLNDVVDALKEYLKLDGVMASKQLIFVCHSMGGIVVRKFLVERSLQLLENKTEIGLFLVASPSLGSEYANWLSPIAEFLGHAQAAALRFTQKNVWLNGLDKEFLNLKESKRLVIKGKELVEDKFIILKKIIGKQLVEPFTGARYFGEQIKIPGSDHFSIAKPENKDDLQHRLLCQFIKDTLFTPTKPLPPPMNPPKPDLEAPTKQQQGKLVTQDIPPAAQAINTLNNNPMPLEIFFSYAHEDEDYKNELVKHLKTLKRQNIIQDWHDREISAGTVRKEAIDTHLETAQIILLLISPDFLNSDKHFEVELKRAMERHEDGEARVIPIILRQCDWKEVSFGKLQALPKNDKPIKTWDDTDEAYLDVVTGLKKVIGELTGRPR